MNGAEGTLDPPVLLDSVIVIDHLNGVTAATEYLADLGARGVVSVVTRAEVLSGEVEETARAAVEALLDTFRTILIDRPVADAAARIRRRRGLRLPDAFQAAAAELHGLALATRDTRHLSPERFDFVVVPY
jgi:hypothetical protein